ncbi:MAG: hypothetical protein KA807_15075 [Prolixibacteraceae bacterium]|nr:hypothetical protein [Prolixibacteraceae bacterium]
MNLNSKKIEIIEKLIKAEDIELIYAIDKLLTPEVVVNEVSNILSEEKEKEIKNKIEVLESNPQRFITKSMLEDMLYKKKS